MLFYTIIKFIILKFINVSGVSLIIRFFVSMQPIFQQLCDINNGFNIGLNFSDSWQLVALANSDGLKQLMQVATLHCLQVSH